MRLPCSRIPRLRRPLAIAALLGLAGCQGTPYQMRFDAAVLDVPPEVVPVDAPPAEDVPVCLPSQGEILLESNCAWCHAAAGGLDLGSPGIVDRMMGVAPSWAQSPPYGCADSGVLLEPSLPPAGILVAKLTNTPTCGSSMTYMSPEQIECVRQWLAQQIAARLDASAGGNDGGSQ